MRTRYLLLPCGRVRMRPVFPQDRPPPFYRGDNEYWDENLRRLWHTRPELVMTESKLTI